MRELRRLETGGAEDQDVLEGVGQVVLAAHDVADAEIDVVGAGGQVIGRRAVAAEQREVFDIVGGFGLLAVDESVKRDGFAVSRGTRNRTHEFFAGGGAAVAFFARNFALAGIGEPGSAGVLGSSFSAPAALAG